MSLAFLDPASESDLFFGDPNGSQFEPILAELEQLRLFYEEEKREEDDV